MVGDASAYAVENMAPQIAVRCQATLCLWPRGRERQSSRVCMCQCCPETMQGMNVCISRKEQQLRMDSRHSQGHPPKACDFAPVTKAFLKKAQSGSLLESEITSEDVFLGWGH